MGPTIHPRPAFRKTSTIAAMPTLELARSLIEAAEAEAREQGLALSFAVVDAGGHVVAIARMDGADWITPEVALGKAWTAAAFRAPSAAQGEKARDLVAFAGSISAATHGRYTPQIGGLPIEVDGAAAGAMGASGAAGHQDEAVVRAAIERVLGAPPQG
jgi:glc operon protein GlcG